MNQAYLKNILSAKFNFDIWKDLLEKIFPKVEIFTSAKKITDSHVKDGGHVGNIRLDDGRSLAIFRFEVADNVQISRNRKSLRDIAAKYVDQGLIHGALVFYYSQNQDDYRLTFIAKQTYFNENGELIKKETAPKRYTFLLGKNEPCTTAASRLIELANKKNYGSIYLTDVTDAFSVERLNKEFFNGYKAQYKKFVDTLSDTKPHRDYVKKLLGRLVFLQFLQKKGWMGVPVSNTKWEGGDKNYLSKLIDTNPNNNRLLSDVLEPLFFKTLNEKRNGDIADSKLGENIKIPYLNGGLFDKDRIDELDIDFPYSYFKELMDFFSQYNFTIDENDPNDSEVGIDPEMLGHIFENLLEDNKDKGAFYTPKEIVQYMCRQSVIQYLKTHEPSEQYAEPIEQLINDGVVSPILQSKNIAIRFTQLLKEVKVCDPAIGSGAFPMGILYVLYHAIHHLHSHAEPHGNFDSTQTKRDIIQNNIFGVDIEQGAVDIARLRFWLALVVDADKPQPLPNLDYKITCGNSLLSRYPIDAPIENVFVEYNKGKKEDEKMSLAKYKELVSDYTNTSNHQTKELFRKTIEDIKCAFKTELSKQFKERLAKLRGKVIMLEGPTLFGERTKAEKAELKKLKKKLNTLEKEQEDIQTNKLYVDAFEWRFEFPQLLDDKGQFTGFDIVIGNPPYGVSIKGEYRKAVVDIHGNVPDYEIYYYFIERARNLICSHGILSYIIPNTWLFNTYAFNYRMQILENWNLIEVLDCTKFPIFESATVRNTIVTWTKSLNTDIGYRRTSDALSFDSLVSTPRIKMKKEELLKMNQNWGLAFFLQSNVVSIINKLSEFTNVLNDFYDCSQGYIPYRLSDLINVYGKENGTKIKDERLWHSTVKSDEYNIQEIYGRDITKYNYKATGEYIKYGKHVACYVDLKFFNQPRLLVREITNPTIIACYVEEQYINDPQLLPIIPKCDNDFFTIYALWAILNSKLATFYHFNHSPKATKGAFPKILVKDLKEFPLPLYDKDIFEKLENCVNTIHESKKENPMGDTSELENQIDLIIYRLYNLTYDEVLIVDPDSPITREEYEKDL
ncbi:MAG: TaqI-like C-terminal specificity domain-containing protein [Bacteroidales bacterium]|nr:TaqI-like C-terminal specificity domain-containing protein [Bacteroidales bacterium]